MASRPMTTDTSTPVATPAATPAATPVATIAAAAPAAAPAWRTMVGLLLDGDDEIVDAVLVSFDAAMPYDDVAHALGAAFDERGAEDDDDLDVALIEACDMDEDELGEPVEDLDQIILPGAHDGLAAALAAASPGAMLAPGSPTLN